MNVYISLLLLTWPAIADTAEPYQSSIKTRETCRILFKYSLTKPAMYFFVNEPNCPLCRRQTAHTHAIQTVNAAAIQLLILTQCKLRLETQYKLRIETQYKVRLETQNKMRIQTQCKYRPGDKADQPILRDDPWQRVWSSQTNTQLVL